MAGKLLLVLFTLAGTTGTSAATLAQQSQWMAIEEAKLIAGDATEKDNFGHCVAVSGDTAVVGAWGTHANTYEGDLQLGAASKAGIEAGQAAVGVVMGARSDASYQQQSTQHVPLQHSLAAIGAMAPHAARNREPPLLSFPW